jgi:hypothetical protein
MPNNNSIALQDRDAKLLRGLFDSRLMTLAHAAAIFFDQRTEAAKKRIQKLKAAGLVGERARKAYEPSILFLTRDGFTLLRDRGLLHDVPALAWSSLENRLQVSDLTLKHELEVLDVKAALSAGISATPTHSVAEFTTWPLLSQFYASPGSGSAVLVKPDGYIRFRQEDDDGTFEHTFFLEVDRSTETVDTLARRALCYLDYYQSGGFAERGGRPRSEFKDFPFRVLMVFKTAERRNNIAERLLTQRPPILTQVWLSTLKEVVANSLGPIWVRPRDYREATDGTPFTVAASSNSKVYRRQHDRQEFIESNVKKLRLLADGQ